jgi:DNA-directed RNA polymerase subunit RPC12/RpoP
LDTLGLSVAPDGNAYCKVCHKTVTAYDTPITITDTSQIQAEDEKEGCPRCGGKVFEAEKMTTKVDCTIRNVSLVATARGH